MGVTDASPWLFARLEPDALREEDIAEYIAETCPDPRKLAFVVDCGRFAHAVVSVCGRDEHERTPIDLAVTIANSITGRCLVDPRAPVFVAIDDYTRENTQKASTTSQRTKLVGANFILRTDELHAPWLSSADMLAMYGSLEAKLAFYSVMQDILTWGHTAFTDRPHCISLDPTQEQLLVKRVAHVHLGLPAVALGEAIPIELDTITDNILYTAGPSAHCIPRRLVITGHVDHVAQRLHLKLEMGGVTKTTQLEAFVHDVQWIPFRFRMANHTLVVNVSHAGEFLNEPDNTISLQYSPTVCLDLFEHLPCPQLRTQPIEADFSSVEFAAALAAAGYKTVIRCAEDSDWTMFATALQQAIIHKGLDTEIISHICPGNRERAPDIWVDNRKAIALPGIKVALLWYLIAPHDYSTGIKGVGRKGRNLTMNLWERSHWTLPFQQNKECPSRLKIDDRQCLRVAQSALQPGKYLADNINNADKVPMTDAAWLKTAYHPLQRVAAALWPLDEIQPSVR
jgi:hypothetical protein